MAPPNISNGNHHQNYHQGDGQMAVNSTSSGSSSSGGGSNGNVYGRSSCSAFQMPLHYPRFKKADYEKMPESQLDCLLREYGLPTTTIGDLDEKRKFAMGAFLWPDEY